MKIVSEKMISLLYHVFTEDVNKIALSANDRRIQSIEKTYA